MSMILELALTTRQNFDIKYTRQLWLVPCCLSSLWVYRRGTGGEVGTSQSGTLAVHPRIMPPDEFSFTSASSLSLDSVAALYTRTFADYFYSAVISAPDMQKFVRVEQIDLDRSPILYAACE